MTYARSTKQVGGTGEISVPLTQPAGATGYRYTDWRTIRQVGPVDLKAGEIVDVRAYEQIDNDSSMRAGDPWVQTVVTGGWITQVRGRFKLLRNVALHLQTQQVDLDPRRTLPVMIELRVERGTKEVIRSQGENADNIVHHWTWARSDFDQVEADAPGSLYVTRIRFGWSAQYWAPGARMAILDRGMLAVKT